MERCTIVFTAITAFAAMISAIIAGYQTANARATQKKTYDEEKKHRTILAYEVLQKEVLDIMVSISKADVENTVRIIKEVDTYSNSELADFKKAYDEYRALLAKCERFAIGVLEGLYDIDIVDKLGGSHLISLYGKFESVITMARYNNKLDGTPYKYFEDLINALRINALRKEGKSDD